MGHSSKSLEIKSYHIPVKNESLHLKRFYLNSEGTPVFLLHGSMENSRIFYSRSLKGLAPYLAEKGYDVFVADLSGRGDSSPGIGKNMKSARSQTDAIMEEIPAFYSFIADLKQHKPQHWAAHSWGGVLMLAYIARFGGDGIASLSFFASKRRISVNSFEKMIKVDLLWNLVGGILGKIYGYFPSKELGLGNDNEPYRYYRQSVKWIYDKEWLDPEDGFDYKAALRSQDVPPTLYIAAKEDHFMGHPKDVQGLMNEVSSPKDKYMLLAKANGNLLDYDHINLLTHPKARLDHFPALEDWIEKNNPPSL